MSALKKVVLFTLLGSQGSICDGGGLTVAIDVEVDFRVFKCVMNIRCIDI